MTAGLLLWVALAGGAGAVARFLLSRALDHLVRGWSLGRWDVPRGATGALGYPLGTAVVNLLGAAGAGFAFGAFGGAAPSPIAVVATVGFLGAFTTFSTWMNEVVLLWQERRRPAAALHLFGTLTAGLLLAYLGSTL